MRRRCIAGRKMNPLGYKILIEVLARGRVRWIAEVGYVFQERLEGESKVTWKQYVDYLRHLVRLRFSLGAMSGILKLGLVGLKGVFVDNALLYSKNVAPRWRLLIIYFVMACGLLALLH